MESSYPQPRLSAIERKEIAENAVTAISNVVSAYCRNISRNDITTLLREKVFENPDDIRREILCDIVPALTAGILPDENYDPRIGNFMKDIEEAMIGSGTLNLINEDGTFASPEYLECQTAELRATAVFAAQNLGIDAHSLITERLPYVISQFIVKTEHPVPPALANKLSRDDIGLLELTAQFNARARHLNEKNRDDLIEKTLHDLPLPPETAFNSPEKIHEIRTVIRDSIWKTWRKCQRLIRRRNRELNLAVKALLREFPNLSTLAARLLGMGN